jgi:hypothetical protein
MGSFTQALIRKSPDRRKEFWAKANSTWPTEREMVEGHTYGELANLMAPWPFMVERGHYDVVSPSNPTGSPCIHIRVRSGFAMRSSAFTPIGGL